jgi:hypothetical protein
VRHRQTKGAATDMLSLPPPRHISTLPINDIGLADIELAAVKSLLSKALIDDPTAAIDAAQCIAERLNEHSEDERLWHGEVMPGVGLVFRRPRQGVTERHLIDSATLLRL